jgi:hypothetical protein
MKEAFALIGVVFVVFSVIAVSALKKGEDQGNKQAIVGAVVAIWVLIAFGIGCYAIACMYMPVLFAFDWVTRAISNATGVSYFGATLVAVVVSLVAPVFPFAFLNARNRKKSEK